MILLLLGMNAVPVLKRLSERTSGIHCVAWRSDEHSKYDSVERHRWMIRALHWRLLPWPRQHGYRLVSIPELLALDPPSLVQLRAGPRGC